MIQVSSSYRRLLTGDSFFETQCMCITDLVVCCKWEVLAKVEAGMAYRNRFSL